MKKVDFPGVPVRYGDACINIQERTYKYVVELSFSKSSTFAR